MTPMLSYLRGYFAGRAARSAVLCAFAVAAGCTGNVFLQGTLPVPPPSTSDKEIAISIAQPNAAATATLGVAAVIRWADIATVPGTIVRVVAQRENDLLEPVGDPINLVGDGTPGVGRDAVADGDADEFLWDVTGVRVGDYVIIATIESPDGASATARSRDEERNTTGVITVTTALPVPTFNFTAPGAADVTVTTGNTFDITWTDNGNANPDALVLLGLDPDTNHANGNEIILLRNDPLSNDGNTGLFTFAFLDENGDTVPDGTYNVFATVDDGANLPVEANATGRLLLNP